MCKMPLLPVVLCAFLLSPSLSHAAGKAVCDMYVAAALSAAQEVRDRRCGGRDPNNPSDGSLDLNHPQWSIKDEDHRRWCMSAPEDQVYDELNQRNAQLRQCRRCDPYSTTAAEQGTKAGEMSCGVDLNHPHWSKDRQAHLRWCMASREETVDAEERNRSEMFGLCEACQRYGNTAVAMALEAGQLKCKGLTGPRWTTDKGGHVLWCMGEVSRGRKWGHLVYPDPEPSHTTDEEDARAGALARCKQEAKAQQGLRKQAVGAAPYTAVPRKKEKAETKPVQAARKPADELAARPKQNVPRSSGSSAMDRLAPAAGGGGSGGGVTASGGTASRGGGGAGSASTATSAGGGGSAAPAMFRGGSNLVAPSGERVR